MSELLREYVRIVLYEKLTDNVEALSVVNAALKHDVKSFRAHQVSVTPWLSYEGQTSDKPWDDLNDDVFEKLKSVDSTQRKVVTLNLDDLVATQATVDKRKLLRYAADWRDTESDLTLPTVLKIDNTYYITDGHHRILLRAMMGQKTIRVQLLEGRL